MKDIVKRIVGETWQIATVPTQDSAEQQTNTWWQGLWFCGENNKKKGLYAEQSNKDYYSAGQTNTELLICFWGTKYPGLLLYSSNNTQDCCVEIDEKSGTILTCVLRGSWEVEVGPLSILPHRSKRLTPNSKRFVLETYCRYGTHRTGDDLPGR